MHLALTSSVLNARNYTLASKLSSSDSSRSSVSSGTPYLPIAKIQWKHKKRKSLESRKEEAEKIHSLYPSSIPIILERANNSIVPAVEKEKFLVPRCLTFREFELLVRRSLLLSHDTVLYLLVGENMPENDIKMGDLFDERRDEDSFLYICYTLDKVFDYEDIHGRIL